MVNLISVRSLLSIESLHQLSNISIDFVLAFPKYDLDVNFFMEIPLEVVIHGNRVKWVPKLNKSLYGLMQEIEN